MKSVSPQVERDSDLKYWKKHKSSFCQNCGMEVYATKKGEDGALICLKCLKCMGKTIMGSTTCSDCTDLRKYFAKINVFLILFPVLKRIIMILC